LLSVVNRIAPHHAESRLRRAGLDCLAVLEKALGWPASDPRSYDIDYRDDQLLIDGREVMQAWEEPVMRAMARSITADRGDVLEIGYGLGISARRILEYGCRSYTVLEPNPAVIERARRWAEGQPTPVVVVPGAWPLDADKLGTYDGIFYDPYPQTWNERTDGYLLEQLRRLREHLEPGGVLTYFGRYRSVLPRAHQRFLYATFSEVLLELVTGLTPPRGCQYWRANTMLAVSCRR
jgi:guanidinoacetate N-methyltransferase